MTRVTSTAQPPGPFHSGGCLHNRRGRVPRAGPRRRPSGGSTVWRRSVSMSPTAPEDTAGAGRHGPALHDREREPSALPPPEEPGQGDLPPGTGWALTPKPVTFLTRWALGQENAFSSHASGTRTHRGYRSSPHSASGWRLEAEEAALPPRNEAVQRSHDNLLIRKGLAKSKNCEGCLEKMPVESSSGRPAGMLARPLPREPFDQESLAESPAWRPLRSPLLCRQLETTQHN